jgi:hypothetical protein
MIVDVDVDNDDDDDVIGVCVISGIATKDDDINAFVNIFGMIIL